jgi:RsiW-degrading membrane proteinase PrsW (M82 family)
MILGGLGLGAFLLFVEGTVAESALAITLISIGIVFIVQSWRALDPARWRQSTKLPSFWIWIGWMVLVWACGILVTQLFPQSISWLLPPAVVLGALLPSMMFLSASLHGLVSPVERKPLLTQLGPRHIVALTFALATSFSTTLSIVVEGITTGIVGVAMVAFAYLSGDKTTYEFLVNAIDEPAFLGSLEQMIVSSPVILVGLGSILVVLAPIIEETLKGMPLLAFIWPKHRQNERLAVLLGVAGGVGFAFAENIGYISMWAEEWTLIFWFRVGAAVMHGAASGFVGRGWYRALAQRRWLAAIWDFSKGLGIHALWNLLALLIGWFSYKGMQEGILFSIIVGLMPLAALFTVMARWGIWVTGPNTGR